MKHIIKTFLFIMLMFALAFINADGVKAACSDGVVCSYSFCGQRGNATDPGYLALNCSNMRVGQVNMHIVFRCSDPNKSASECDSFVSWAYAYKNSVNSSDGTGAFEIKSWGNYDYLFHRTDALFKNYFKTKVGGFECPNIYASLTNGLSDDVYTFGYVQPSGISTTVSTTDPDNTDPNWYENFQAWNGMPISGRQVVAGTTCIDNTTDLDKIKNDLAGETATEVIDEVERQEEALSSKITIDITTIVNWAINQGYTIDSVGDPCTVVSDSLRDLLSLAFWVISIAGVILVVVMTAIGFIKAIVGSDDEKLRNAFSHLVTRIITVVILLLLPVFLTFIINVINAVSGEGEVTVGSDGNIFCDIT